MSRRTPDRPETSAHEPPYVLAIDVGSSSARAAVFDSRAQRLPDSFQQTGYQLRTGVDGRAELDPHELVRVVADLIDRALAGYPDLSIDIVGAATFWHSIIGIDREGEPLTGVLTWADTRAAGAVRRLRQSLDERAYHQTTGTRLHSSYPFTKLVWLRDANPGVWARAARWASFPEYLQFRLLGEWRCSVSMASATGLMDRRACGWNAEALDRVGINADQLSEIGERPIDGLRQRFVERWPQLSEARWLPAIGDGAANNLGAGATGPRLPALMIGTTGAMRVLTRSLPDPIPDALWQYRLDRDFALVGGALSEGGNVFDWMRQHLNLPESYDVGVDDFRAEPDEHGLTWLPFLAGERSPGWNSDAFGVLHGIRLDTKPIDIVQAALEGISYRFALLYRHLDDYVESHALIVATGNGLRKNPIWIQILADVLARPIVLPDRTEASLRGAAIHALGSVAPSDGPGPVAVRAELLDSPPQGRRFEPDLRLRETYDRAIARQQALYERLIPNPVDSR
jgi:gluconokinase